ncbi:sodium:proton antiporter [Actinocorallia longicatena]|uniref:Na+/H+ antiporter n=1 Tax=Actinocorallia longicatena TaxID=111803 RepID=A0ABP6QJ19_9ACTN
MEHTLVSFGLIVILMLATVLLVGVGEKIRRPYPVLVTLFGILLAVLPWVPEIEIDPELILPLFLPPLIYAAAQRTSWRMIQARKRTIVGMALLLVAATVVAAAGVTFLLVGGITVAAAVALGSAVAPPDPVAAEAVAGPLGLPRRLVTILQTEGLCNDATALVIYAVAVSAITGGHYSMWDGALLFVWEVAAALAMGLGLGWAATWVQRHMATTDARNALTLVFPFAVYLLADLVHSSGVLAVLVGSLYLGQTTDDESGVSDRLTGSAFWETIELLITGLAFGLIGLELRDVLPPLAEFPTYAWHAAVVCAVVIVLRLVWMLVVGVWLRRRHDELDGMPESWKEDFVISYCGMRGLATLALALALPLSTPARDELLFIAFAVILVTMVFPGLTLPWVVRVLGVRDEDDAEEQEIRDLAFRASRASLRRLRELDAEEDLPSEVVQKLRLAQRLLVSQLCDTVPDDMAEDYDQRRSHSETRDRVEAEMLAASRREVLLARAEPGVDPEAADKVLRRLDLRSAHLL